MSTLTAHGPVVVCHTLPPAERLSTALRTFDALAAGEAFELQSDHAQTPALAHFQKERPGRFEWSPLQEGPDLWRTRVARRVDPTTHRAVTEALSFDHDRLDDLESEAFAARAAGDLALATRLFNDFVHGLRRHIAFEEKLLFPAFEARAGLSVEFGPTAVMRQEHRVIEAHLHDMGRRFSTLDDAMTGARQAFHEIMHKHNAKEEDILYPATDGLLAEGERDELVGRIQAFTA